MWDNSIQSLSNLLSKLQSGKNNLVQTSVDAMSVVILIIHCVRIRAIKCLNVPILHRSSARCVDGHHRRLCSQLCWWFGNWCHLHTESNRGAIHCYCRLMPRNTTRTWWILSSLTCDTTFKDYEIPNPLVINIANHICNKILKSASQTCFAMLRWLRHSSGCGILSEEGNSGQPPLQYHRFHWSLHRHLRGWGV